MEIASLRLPAGKGRLAMTETKKKAEDIILRLCFKLFGDYLIRYSFLLAVKLPEVSRYKYTPLANAEASKVTV